jgi:hypothetical protein
MKWAFGVLVLLSIGCGTEGGKDIDDGVDSDGDGLTDVEEEELGTDPNLDDSDGDEFSDGEEVKAGTDPLDFHDHPYYGGWPKDGCADDVVPTGGDYIIGSVAHDFKLLDQYGKTEKVRLYDFCDHTVLLVSSAFG